jgi:hypothetical protein
MRSVAIVSGAGLSSAFMPPFWQADVTSSTARQQLGQLVEPGG